METHWWFLRKKILGSSVVMARSVKVLPAMQETQVWTLGCHDPLEKEVTTHSGTLAGKFHGQRSLAGYSPCSRKESDMTKPSAVSLEECREQSGLERRETESVDRREAAVITEAAMRPHWARGCGSGKKGEPFQRLRLCSSWVPTVRRVPCCALSHVYGLGSEFRARKGERRVLSSTRLAEQVSGECWCWRWARSEWEEWVVCLSTWWKRENGAHLRAGWCTRWASSVSVLVEQTSEEQAFYPDAAVLV